jgi:hypothetical protein
MKTKKNLNKNFNITKDKSSHQIKNKYSMYIITKNHLKMIFYLKILRRMNTSRQRMII